MKKYRLENKPLTDEQKEMLAKMEQAPINFDDIPELTEEQLAQFYRVKEKNREDRIKETVTLRISHKSLVKAKSLGKGYTSVLARILESALCDNELLQKYL